MAKKSNISSYLTIAGRLFIALSVVIVMLIYGPIILEELGFTAKQMVPALKNTAITPLDDQFGIVIPKLEANAAVVPNVDPYNSRIYQIALTKGVAHAKGTAVPGENGNIFLFSHSSVNFYEAARYNSVFYLLSKLEPSDEIDLYYLGSKYVYRVTEKKTVSNTAVEYLKPKSGSTEIVTLMTCWPPGTTYKRLLIIAERNL